MCSLYACVLLFCFLFALFPCFSWFLMLPIVVYQNDLIEYLSNILNTPEKVSFINSLIYSYTVFLNTSVPHCFIFKITATFSYIDILYTNFLAFQDPKLLQHSHKFSILALFIDIFPAISLCTLVHQHKFVPHYLLSFECRKYAIFLCNDYNIMSFTSVFKL